jgi:4-amino-4-deoxy-L-arabinose transferase-like glycosyltransferase
LALQLFHEIIVSCQMNSFPDNHPTLSTCLKLVVISVFALAITLPFAGQAFSLDGPLVIDFASSQTENPLRQHIDDFDYFGIRYDQFTNTHPRFLSFYLSLVIRIFGVSEVPVHLALAFFPVIGGISMYYLGRRFGVSGVAAGMLLLASPAFMVSAHTEMVDLPGTSLWLAALTAFIYGVDRRKKLLLGLACLLFLLTIFTFYQGLSMLALALFYLILKKRFSIAALAAIIVPVILFLFYILLFYLNYGEPPRFTYRIPIPFYDKTILNQLRGLLVVIGGTLMFPLVLLAGFLRNWRIVLAGLLATAVIWPWLFVRHQNGSFSLYETLALGLLVTAGVVVCYVALEQTIIGLVDWIRKKDNDVLLLTAWFLGICFYTVVLLGYLSPRYFLPALPAVILIMLRLWRGTKISKPVLRTVLASSAVTISLVFSIAISIAYMDYAEEARETADWALAEYGDHDGRVWFSGELGYAYYMRQKGFTMVPSVMWQKFSQTTMDQPDDLPVAGDIIIGSSLAGNWLPYSDLLPYLRLEDNRLTWSDHELVVWSYGSRSRWSTTLLLPYDLSQHPQNVDNISIWTIVEEPLPLSLEVEEEVARWS